MTNLISNLLIYSFFLIPGIASFLIIKDVGDISREFDRFEKLFFSVVLSGVSLILVQISRSIHGYKIPSDPLSFVSNLGLESQAWIFISELFFALSISFTLIIGVRRWVPEKHLRDQYTIWEMTFNKTENPKRVIVSTESRELFGEVHAYGESKYNKDIVLRYPYDVKRSENGNIKKLKQESGPIYLQENEIKEFYIHSENGIKREY